MRHTSIGIVAHHSRIDRADKLSETVDAVVVSVDDGVAGVLGNHRRVWERLSKHHSEWSAVLEDDALPVDGFSEQLSAALSAAPTPVVGLYVGQVRPARWQRKVQRAIWYADETDAHWLICTHILHCVGVAARTEHAGMMVQSLDRWRNYPPEEALSRGCRHAAIQVAHTWPSLIDHDDTEASLISPPGRNRNLGRVAWRTGARSEWTARSVQL